MDADQDSISRYFEGLYRAGQKPWTLHDPGSLLESFFDKLKEEFGNAKVLDIGCGNGWISLMVAKRGHQVWGIDSSETAILEAKGLSEKANVSNLTHFEVGNALDLPYKDNFFEGLVDRGLFHHILPKNRNLYLENIKRVLKPESLVYLSVFSMENPEGIGQRFTKDKIESIFGEIFSIDTYDEDPFPPDSPAHLLHFILRRK
ncbi:hypothetical protein A2165_03760 [Candidatus Curtissbacteria bacterium RBG_13_40_7]|uniref:Methyltransferase domain-containing protein n=1 Tax=Candidatus Curtissbacteria bacterium RBG_13_40_7 TaxID=1797706 RepID=A0A1F5FUI6_9BACT|nr:MAG: hypothetical protein A2165_03760 [Candidatus Curtissbacteria bacterium RBG_13_40_7]